MANIVVAMHNFLLKPSILRGCPPYYETFINGLRENGNNVLCFQFSKHELKKKEIPEEYLSKLQKFRPDLFIFFTNQFWDISTYFEQPIIIYDIDSPIQYCNLDLLRKDSNRYRYIITTYSGYDTHREFLNCSKKNILYVPPFTGIRSYETSFVRNIGFVGSHWLWNDYDGVLRFLRSKPTLEERKIAKKIYDEFVQYPYVSLEELYTKNNENIHNKLIFSNLLVERARISGLRRLRCLTEIADLGLEIRGNPWLESDLLKCFPEVLFSYSYMPVNNKDEVEEFFNSSKISINTKHIQALSGFSWRVCDILASNACLVSEYAKDLVDLGFKVPMFESPAEAREQCTKLLKNENMRKDIVAHSHEIVNKKHRFKHILPFIEDFLGMTLHSDDEGSLEIISIFNNVLQKNINTKHKQVFPTLDKNRLTKLDKWRYKIAKHLYKEIRYQEKKRG